MRELIESFDKKSGQVLAEARKMLGDVSAAISKSSPTPAAPPRRR
jgi:phospholipid/cholesterol/gamma-HCH transport system substrate-binding protein